MKIRCAWHGEIVGEKEPLEDDRITDGICPSCAAKVLAQIPLPPGRSVEREMKAIQK